MNESPTSISKTFLYVLFALIIIGFQLSGTLVIIQGIMGYTGYDQNKIVVTSCNSQVYKITKFMAIVPMIKLSFIMSIISTACFIIICIITFIWVRRVCNIKQTQTVSNLIQRRTKIVLYILAFISILALIPVFGYYLTFIVQMPHCESYTYDVQQIRAITIISAILLCISLTMVIIFFYLVVKDTSQEKYKQLGTHQTFNTEPAQNIQPAKYRSNKYQNQKKPVQIYKNSRATPSPPPPPPKLVYTNQPDKQHTQQNLFQNSTKKALAVNYNKQPINQQVAQQPKFKSPIQKYVYQKNPQPKPYTNISSNYRIPQSSIKKPSPPKQGQLVFHRNRSFMNKDDQQTFKNEQQRYISKYGGPILPQSGVTQKQSREKKLGSDYFNSPNKKNFRQNSPPNDKGKQGVLVKYIRNKYAY